MTTVNTEPDVKPAAGVMTSSCSPSRANDAACPLTSRREIEKPRKSRSKLDRFCVAVAVIVAVPESWFVDGS